jgi:hypothetical protein
MTHNACAAGAVLYVVLGPALRGWIGQGCGG